MDIPKIELEYYLGKGYGKIKWPEAVKKLKKKGIKVSGKMTVQQIFDAVIEYYNEDMNK